MRKQGTYLRKDTGSLHIDGENYSTKQGMAHLHSGHPDPWPRSSPPRVERPGQRHPDSLCSCTVIPFPAQQRLNKARSMHSDKWEVCWSITLPGGLWFCATCWPRLPVEQSEVPSTWASMRGEEQMFPALSHWSPALSEAVSTVKSPWPPRRLTECWAYCFHSWSSGTFLILVLTLALLLWVFPLS